jgi:hypothetical protein
MEVFRSSFRRSETRSEKAEAQQRKCKLISYCQIKSIFRGKIPKDDAPDQTKNKMISDECNLQTIWTPGNWPWLLNKLVLLENYAPF